MEIKEIIELLEAFKVIKPMSSLNDFEGILDRHLLISESVVKHIENLLKIPVDDLKGENISIRSFVEILKGRIEYYKPLIIEKRKV